MAYINKINIMHKAYGITDGKKCKQCEHFACYHHHDKRYYKCLKFGVTNGQGTDWRCNNTACGLFIESEVQNGNTK